MLLHGSCAARDGEAVLFLGPPGAGKSDLVLRLLDRPGWQLVADDQVRIEAVQATHGSGDAATASPPGEGTRAGATLRVEPAPVLRGMLEVRGLGLFTALPVAEPAWLRLAVECTASRESVPRLPEPTRFACAGHSVPLIRLHAFDGSAPAKVEWALAAAAGRMRMRAGAFETADRATEAEADG